MEISASIERHMHRLCEEIGERLIGTDGNREAANYIYSVFESSHLQIKQLYFSCPNWHCDNTSLFAGDLPITAKANTFSPACHIRAGYDVVYTMEQLRSASLVDRVLVMCGELTQQPIPPYNENAVYLPESAREIGLLLRSKKPKAVVFINQTPNYELLMLEDQRLDIPSVTLSADEGIKLLAHPGATLTLDINSYSEQGETCHIVGRNLQPSDQRRLLLCAHYDSRYGTVGAFDNASGVAVLLTLAELFAEQNPTVSLEFVAFSSEEYQVADSYDDPYLSQYGLSIPPFDYTKEIAAPYKPSDLDNVIAVLNFDGVGHTLGANAITTMSCSTALKDTVVKVKESFPAVTIVGGWPASNHYAFYSNGIPSLPFNSVGMNNIIHNPIDDMRYMSTSKMVEVVTLAQQIVHALADKTPAWSRIFDLP
ncbi:MAG: M28 family peptidase [Anaerolineae bacterium]